MGFEFGNNKIDNLIYLRNIKDLSNYQIGAVYWSRSELQNVFAKYFIPWKPEVGDEVLYMGKECRITSMDDKGMCIHFGELIINVFTNTYLIPVMYKVFPWRPNQVKPTLTPELVDKLKRAEQGEITTPQVVENPIDKAFYNWVHRPLEVVIPPNVHKPIKKSEIEVMNEVEHKVHKSEFHGFKWEESKVLYKKFIKPS